jgi:hypothetical protein
MEKHENNKSGRGKSICNKRIQGRLEDLISEF